MSVQERDRELGARNRRKLLGVTVATDRAWRRLAIAGRLGSGRPAPKKKAHAEA
jgi:hypothetical protein